MWPTLESRTTTSRRNRHVSHARHILLALVSTRELASNALHSTQPYPAPSVSPGFPHRTCSQGSVERMHRDGTSRDAARGGTTEARHPASSRPPVSQRARTVSAHDKKTNKRIIKKRENQGVRDDESLARYGRESTDGESSMAQASMYVTTTTRPVVSLSLPLLPPLSRPLSRSFSARSS